MPITLNPSNSDPRVFKVAAVQAEPEWLNLQGSVDKTIRLIHEASAQGAKIIGFPEVFIPGYPWTPWVNNYLVTEVVLKEYQANALALHSPEMDRIREAVKEADITAVIGFSERDGASLYIAQATILPDGKIANHRRKIKTYQPTHYEKTVFGDGSAQSMYNVVQTPYGRQARFDELLGTHSISRNITFSAQTYRFLFKPWFKTHFYSQHPQIFVGGWWPAFAPGLGGSPYIVSGEASSRMTQSVSMEGGCFGLACCHVVSEKGAEIMKMTGFPWFSFPGGGFTTIYGPDGSTLAKADDPGVEQIVYADISLNKIDEVKRVADITGNYSRMDLFHTVADGKNWVPIEYSNAAEAEANRERAGEIDNYASGAY